MKLNQLGLTPNGVKATKKLGGQVHKATIAAALEPKLKLGVVGIDIGQEQSTGLTSRVDEDQASPSATLKRIFNMLGLKRPHLSVGDYDLDEVLEDTAKILAMHRTAYTAARNVCSDILDIGNDLTGTAGTRIEELSNTCTALTEHITLQPWFMEGVEAIKLANQKAKAMRAHATAVSRFVDMFRLVIEHIEQGKESNWTPYYKIATAAFKKIGAM